jgi:ATP/maltotriose-dependent transcriptional regulator MalT
LIANDDVALLDWEELRLTLDEACAIALLRKNINPEEVARIHERSDGWAAGLVLMLERLRRSAA